MKFCFLKNTAFMCEIDFPFMCSCQKYTKYAAWTDWQKCFQGCRSQRMCPGPSQFHVILEVQLRLLVQVYLRFTSPSIYTDRESFLAHPHPSLLIDSTTNYCAVASSASYFLWSQGMCFLYNLLCVLISSKMAPSFEKK